MQQGAANQAIGADDQQAILHNGLR
jgi:hypothetical protein